MGKRCWQDAELERLLFCGDVTTASNETFNKDQIDTGIYDIGKDVTSSDGYPEKGR